MRRNGSGAARINYKQNPSFCLQNPMLSLNNHPAIRHLLHSPASQLLQYGDRDNKSEKFPEFLQKVTSMKRLESSTAPRGQVEDTFSAVLK